MARNISFMQAINEALGQEMERDPTVVVFGEDVVGGSGAPGEDDAWGGVSQRTITLARVSNGAEYEQHREVPASGPREGCPQSSYALGPQCRPVLRTWEGVSACGQPGAAKTRR